MTSDDRPSQSGRVPAGAPGWKKATCLGCDRPVVRSRDPWVVLCGTRSASYLVTWGADPKLARATSVDDMPDGPFYLFGVAHQTCINKARNRLRAGASRPGAALHVVDIEVGEHLLGSPYTLHLPPEEGACPFCDQDCGLTREHVWPLWYSRELEAMGAALAGEHVQRGRIDLTVQVCGECNHTWMSVLETDAAPILKRMMRAGTVGGGTFQLGSEEQRFLAVWALKTAYLLDVHTHPSVPRGFLHTLALQRQPPDSAVVWVAGYTPDVAARAEKRELDFRTQAGARTNDSPNAFAVTFTIFNVLFQVLGYFIEGGATLSDDRRQYEGALFRIWPPTGADLAWPPSFGFSRPSWDDLVASISDGSD